MSFAADVHTTVVPAPGSNQPPLPLADAPEKRVTWRSFLLGSLGVCLVCGLTPYNDFVLGNTFLIGNYLPVVIVVTFFILTVLVNGPLCRFKPRWALSSGELAIILLMMLVSCGLPSQGLFRLFLPIPVVPFHFGQTDSVFFQTFLGMHLPNWLFPLKDQAHGTSSPVVQGFYSHIPGYEVPYRAWVTPLLGWGIFIFAMFGTFVALAALLRPQWAVNERLAFPIAQIELALIEQPRPGRMLNDLLGNRLFWIALVVVFVIHSVGVLHDFFPRSVPDIPLNYALGRVLTGEPWRFLRSSVKGATIYFAFIGITYFIQSRIAFSLWFIVLATEIFDMEAQNLNVQIHGDAWREQHLGACIAYTLGFLWIGRRYWWNIFQQTLGRRQNNDPTQLSSVAARTAVIVAMLGIAVMITWLGYLGVQAWCIILIISFILMSHVTTSRVVAETGLTFFRCDTTPDQIYTNLPTRLMAGKDVFFMGVFRSLGAINTRESVLNFSLHGLQVNQAQIDARETTALRPRRGYLGAMALLIAWSLILGFFICSWSSLHCFYNHDIPMSSNSPDAITNQSGKQRFPQSNMIGPVDQWASHKFNPKNYNPWEHIAIGLGITSFLQIMALRFASWPLLPVGYLYSHTVYANDGWYSIMLGWLAKVLLVRFGGASLYQRAKPFFIGLIFGEALTVGFWVIFNIMLAQTGHSFQRIIFLPD